MTFGLVREAQQRGEPVGWVTSMASCFYPPDAAQSGTDLAALVVIRIPAAEKIARAGEKLLRSGGFGLLVFDLGTADIPMPLQSRLDRTRPSSPDSIGLSHRKTTQGVFSGIAGVAAPSRRKETRFGKSLCLHAQCSQRQTSWTDLEP